MNDKVNQTRNMLVKALKEQGIDFSEK